MASSAMAGGGFYNLHSTQQEEVSAAGIALLEQAIAELPEPVPGPMVLADFGSSEGRNSLAPLQRPSPTPPTPPSPPTASTATSGASPTRRRPP